MSACFLLTPDKSGLVVLTLRCQIVKDIPKARIDTIAKTNDKEQINHPQMLQVLHQ